VTFEKPTQLTVVDHVTGPEGRHAVEQRWLTPANVRLDFACEPAAHEEPAERSTAFGSREPARRWIARYEGTLPATLTATIKLDTR
jgi:hypothetical protein